MTTKPSPDQLQAAKVFVDRIVGLSAKSGHGIPLKGERYEQIVKDAARMAARLQPTRKR